jgi:hypothetical protein
MTSPLQHGTVLDGTVLDGTVLAWPQGTDRTECAHENPASFAGLARDFEAWLRQWVISEGFVGGLRSAPWRGRRRPREDRHPDGFRCSGDRRSA